MCGRYTLITDIGDLAERFLFQSLPAAYAPRYNIAPTQSVLTVGNGEATRIAMLRWGLIPSWSKDASIGNRLINARAETAAEKPAFRASLRKRRCLVLADGFYEWQKEGKSKVPHYVCLQSRAPFAFAGLWASWKDAAARTIHSCTILTTTPNELVAPIHNRMPVILPRAAEAIWLDPGVDQPKDLLPLLRPYPSECMQAYAVSALVNSPRNDLPACVEPHE